MQRLFQFHEHRELLRRGRGVGGIENANERVEAAVQTSQGAAFGRAQVVRTIAAFFAFDGCSFRFQRVGCLRDRCRLCLLRIRSMLRNMLRNMFRNMSDERFQLRPQAAHLLQRFVVLVKSIGNFPVELELLGQVFGQRLYPRIHANVQRLRVALAANCEDDFIRPGQHRGAERSTRRVVIDGRDRVVVSEHVGRGISQVPNETMHPRGGR